MHGIACILDFLSLLGAIIACLLTKIGAFLCCFFVLCLARSCHIVLLFSCFRFCLFTSRAQVITLFLHECIVFFFPFRLAFHINLIADFLFLLTNFLDSTILCFFDTSLDECLLIVEFFTLFCDSIACLLKFTFLFVQGLFSFVKGCLTIFYRTLS